MFQARKYKSLSDINPPERPSYKSIHVGLTNNGLPHEDLKFYNFIYLALFFQKSKEPRMFGRNLFKKSPARPLSAGRTSGPGGTENSASEKKSLADMIPEMCLKNVVYITSRTLLFEDNHVKFRPGRFTPRFG
jgi:hypothetical protein